MFKLKTFFPCTNFTHNLNKIEQKQKHHDAYFIYLLFLFYTSRNTIIISSCYFADEVELQCCPSRLKTFSCGNTGLPSKADQLNASLATNDVNSESTVQKPIDISTVDEIDNPAVIDLAISANSSEQNSAIPIFAVAEVLDGQLDLLNVQSIAAEQKVSTDHTKFVKICEELHDNPSCISMPGEWVPHIITNELPCIMWLKYKKGYVSCEKRIVLFPDMKINVSFNDINEIIFSIIP